MSAAHPRFVSPVGTLIYAYLWEPDDFQYYKVHLALARADGVAFEREIRALVGPTDRDLKFHEDVDGKLVFRFRLAARTQISGGRWFEQKPRLFGPDNKPADFFGSWLAERGRVAGEAYLLPTFKSEALRNASNPMLRLRAVQFM